MVCIIVKKLSFLLTIENCISKLLSGLKKAGVIKKLGFLLCNGCKEVSNTGHEGTMSFASAKFERSWRHIPGFYERDKLVWSFYESFPLIMCWCEFCEMFRYRGMVRRDWSSFWLQRKWSSIIHVYVLCTLNKQYPVLRVGLACNSGLTAVLKQKTSYCWHFQIINALIFILLDPQPLSVGWGPRLL